MTRERYDHELELPRDGDGRVVGYQVGKAHALSEWSHRKEEREYKKLFKRLSDRNYSAKKRREDPERVRAKARKWAAKKRREDPAHIRALAAKSRAKKRAARDRTKLCEWCGARWEPARSWARWCSKRCANAYHGSRRTHRHAQAPCGVCGAMHNAQSRRCIRCANRESGRRRRVKNVAGGRRG